MGDKERNVFRGQMLHTGLGKYFLHFILSGVGCHRGVFVVVVCLLVCF